jgi:hypothetical protein
VQCSAVQCNAGRDTPSRCDVGSLGSGQHLASSVSILLALAHDSAFPVMLSGLASDGPGVWGMVEPAIENVL